MTSGGNHRSSLALMLAAGAVLSLAVVPVAFAGSAEDERAKANKAVSSKKFKKLKDEVKLLQQQLGEVSKQQGPQGPPGVKGEPGEQGAPGLSTGPAGGDLAGTYPNPDIGAVQTPITGTGALDNGSITSGFGSVNIGTDTFTGLGSGLTNLNATNLSTGAVPTARLAQRVDATSPTSIPPAGEGASVPVLVTGYLDGSGNDLTLIENATRTLKLIDAWSVNNLSHSASATWRLAIEDFNPGVITDTVEVNDAATDDRDINRVGEINANAHLSSGVADLVVDVTAGNPDAFVFVLALPE